MPIYAFQCAECGHNFDRLQKLSDPDPTVCPSCGAEAVKRQVTAPSFAPRRRRLVRNGLQEEWRQEAQPGGERQHRRRQRPSSGGGDAKPAATPKADPKPASWRRPCKERGRPMAAPLCLMPAPLSARRSAPGSRRPPTTGCARSPRSGLLRSGSWTTAARSPDGRGCGPSRNSGGVGRRCCR